jgi:hypothetical protein
MKKQWLFMLSVLLLFTLGSQALAFSDTKTTKNEAKINALQEAGVLSGVGNDKFNPSGNLSYASGISMIVKGLDVSLARFSFIKAPKASDYYTNVKDGEWYSDAFIIAQVNGLEIPKDVKPDLNMTREQFAFHLFRGMEANNQHAYPLIFAEIKDAKDITKAYEDSIQKLLVSKIITLDSQQKFNPKALITRGDAAAWLYDARQFVKNTAQMPQPGQPNPLTELTLVSKAISDTINQITVSAQAPHPGYGIHISSIQFNGKDAVIYTEPILPDPDKMYAQVISTVTDVTYIGSQYRAVLAESGGTSPSTPMAGASQVSQ